MKDIFKQIKWIVNYILSIIMYAIIVILLLVGVILLAYYIDIQKRAKSGVWEPPLYSAYVIVSGSMEPIIEIKDAVITKRVEASELKVGDVVTYKSTDPAYYGILITHRIMSITKDGNGYQFVTKGDNNLTNDRNMIMEDQIYGKVIMRVPKIGYLKYFLVSSYGWIIAIVIPCLGIVIYDVMKLIKNIKNKNFSKSGKKYLDGGFDE